MAKHRAKNRRPKRSPRPSILHNLKVKEKYLKKLLPENGEVMNCEQKKNSQ